MLRILKINKNLRYYATKQATKNTIKYTNTINLPKTKFPNRLSAEKRAEVERKLLQTTFAQAYNYQELHKEEPTFVLHDGPPYANGDLHMGHAVNKILKDITLRQHVARGRRVHYIPGWDCHGLPIELKAMAAQGADKKATQHNALDIREKSRAYALDALERQKQEFHAWGILANWNNIYLTIQPEVIAKQLDLFMSLYEKGLVYRDLKPVYWSPSSRTALAEAELEYDPQHVSTSAYVRFPLCHGPANLDLPTDAKVYALIWTTTPWTLPSNQAICYNQDMQYSLIRIRNRSDSALYVMASKLLADLQGETSMELEILKEFPGTDLAHCTYEHPFAKQEPLPFIHASHVQDSKGTGLVHTAPAHGPEDFLVSLEHKLPIKSLVNEAGEYTEEAPSFLLHRSALDEGDKLVLEHLNSDVLHNSKFVHSYPIDWRTKRPVIIRASKQWFINTEQLKDLAVAEAETIEVFPRSQSESSKKALLTQVRKRPYWCISRQRVWGVPIPVFYSKSSDRVLTNRNVVDHISNTIKQKGNVDFWWSQTPQEILPPQMLQELSDGDPSDIQKGLDIFDIWFDSGSTWYSVLPEKQKADLYLEGYDQFTGWFQSSLMTSVAARQQAPFKAIFVHGFTVDEKGHKMSKSLGNVISPKDLTQKYGADVLRWWVAAHGPNNMSITVSPALIQQAAESLSKIRATLRYMNGVIGERPETAKQDYHEEQPKEFRHCYLNKYLLSSLVSYDQEVQKSYDNYEYNRVVAHIQNFVANQISAVYVNLIKDRLYCGPDQDLEAIRYTLTKCYELLCKTLWPITPFLVEESWSYYDASSSFHEHNVKALPNWCDQQSLDAVNVALDVKRLLNQSIQQQNTWTVAVRLRLFDKEKLHLLQQLHGTVDAYRADTELCEILQCAEVELIDCTLDTRAEEQPFAVECRTLDSVLCSRCRRFAVDQEGCVCPRCSEVLQSKGF